MKRFELERNEKLVRLLTDARDYENRVKRKTQMSDRLLGRCAKPEARWIRKVLTKVGFKVYLWPREPINPSPRRTSSGCRSQSLRHHGACSIYVVGCKARDVYALVFSGARGFGQTPKCVRAVVSRSQRDLLPGQAKEVGG